MIRNMELIKCKLCNVKPRISYHDIFKYKIYCEGERHKHTIFIDEFDTKEKAIEDWNEKNK